MKKTTVGDIENKPKWGNPEYGSVYDDILEKIGDIEKILKDILKEREKIWFL